MLTPETLTEEFKKIYADNLYSVILYGSAVTGDYVKRKSDFNILVVVNRLGLDDLKKVSGITQKWVKAGNPPPLMFTMNRLINSMDVFPLEFIDIKDKHKILFGEDVFGKLEIKTGNLRLELERELKSKIIQLRESYILTGGEPKKVRELLIKSASTIMALMRGALRLYNITPPIKKLEAVAMLAEKIRFDVSIFTIIWGMKEGSKESYRHNPDTLFEQYLGTVEKVTDTIDALGSN